MKETEKGGGASGTRAAWQDPPVDNTFLEGRSFTRKTWWISTPLAKKLKNPSSFFQFLTARLVVVGGVSNWVEVETVPLSRRLSTRGMGFERERD